MALTKRQISIIMSREHNRKVLAKGFAYYYLRWLLSLVVMVPLFSIPAFRAGAPWYGFLFIVILLLMFYSFMMGSIWGIISIMNRWQKQAIAKMNISHQTYEKVVQEHSKDRSFTAQVHENLMKHYQVERLQELPAFQIYENPMVYDKIRALLGWNKLDKNHKENKHWDRLGFVGLGVLLVCLGFGGPNNLAVLTWVLAGFSFLYALLPPSIGETNRVGNRDSRSIYTEYLHYWNRHFSSLHGQSRETMISFGKRHVFDADDTYQVNNIDVRYEASNLLKKHMSDYIAYVYKTDIHNDDHENSNIGILWNPFMPYVKDIGAKMKVGFYLLPAGIKPLTTEYTYYTTREGYDVYIIGESPGKALDHVLEFIRPFTERELQVNVEYVGGSMSIYLPDFLPDYKHITSEEELMHVCKSVDRFYSLLKRSLYWRYGNVEEWEKGEL